MKKYEENKVMKKIKKMIKLSKMKKHISLLPPKCLTLEVSIWASKACRVQ